MFRNLYSKKKVLITGHTGFKGSWLCMWLKKLGAEVAGASLYIPSTPSHYDILDLPRHLLDYKVDVRSLNDLEKVFLEFQPEVSFHLAAMPLVRECYDSPKNAFDTNLGGTVNFLECARNSKSLKAAVIITSDKCYKNNEWDFGYREVDQLGGDDPYSASKACAEIAFSSYYKSYFLNSNKFLATARAGNVIGGGDWAKDRIVPDCIRAWELEQIAHLRSPNATRPWQHVLEALSGYLWLASELLTRPNDISGEAFNFGPSASQDFTVLELVEAMKKKWSGSEYLINQIDIGNRKEATALKLSCDKAFKRLNWFPLLDFSTTATLTGEWYYQYSQNVNPFDLTMSQINFFEKIAVERKISWATV